MVVCSKAPVGSCCTEDRTGRPAWKWSNSQVTVGGSCQEARAAFCAKAGVGSKYCPSMSMRPVAQKPQCGKMFANRGFTCCCGGQPNCGPSGYTFTANRQDCCNKFGRGGGKCFNDPTLAPIKAVNRAPAELASRFPGGARTSPMGPVAAMPLKSRFPGGPRTSPTYPQYTDTNPKVVYPRQPVYKPQTPTLPQTSGTLTPTDTDQAARISRRYKNAPQPYPSGEGAGGSPPTNTPGDAPPTSKAPAKGGIVDQLCPYFKWVPFGGTDCNMQVLAGVAIVGLGGALLIKMLKGR